MSYAALESLHDPVIVTDARQRIINLNRSAEAIFGPVPESPRKPVSDHISDRRIVNSIKKIFDNPAVVPNSEAQQTELFAAGQKRTFLLRTSAMRDDENHLLGSVTVLEDITHLKHIDKLKTEFIGVASHELKTPVASLLLSAQFLEEGGAGPLNETQSKLITLQRVDLERLDRLTKELLDLTKLEEGSSPPRLEPVEADEVIDSAFRDLRGFAKDKQIELIKQMPPAVMPRIRADRSQLGRVLINLVGNAIRHSPGPGRVLVSVSPLEDVVTFEVKDFGEGIPPEYLHRIFERFVQVPGATQGGAGLGLAIVDNIVRAHGGTISVVSETGIGTTFTFTIPSVFEELEP